MTGDLVPLPTFEGKEIRTFEQYDTIWFSLIDLSKAWGLHRNTMRALITRNSRKFNKHCKTLEHVTCPSNTLANDSLKCIDEIGLYVLMGAVNTDRLKSPEAAEAIFKFQEWIPILIQRYRKKEIMQQTNNIDTELQQARRIAELTDTDPRIMQAAALRKCGLPEYADVLVPEVSSNGTGWYNPSGLVKLCNDPLLNAERLNWYLRNKGYQYRDGFLWRLTPEGMEHGKEYIYTAPSQHQEIRISWRESILYASGLKHPIANDQAALAASVHG